MNIYKATIKRYNNGFVNKTVAANNLEKAIDNVSRFIKKNYYLGSQIQSIVFTEEVDIFYKS